MKKKAVLTVMILVVTIFIGFATEQALAYNDYGLPPELLFLRPTFLIGHAFMVLLLSVFFTIPLMFIVRWIQEILGDIFGFGDIYGDIYTGIDFLDDLLPFVLGFMLPCAIGMAAAVYLCF